MSKVETSPATKPLSLRQRNAFQGARMLSPKRTVKKDFGRWRPYNSNSSPNHVRRPHTSSVLSPDSRPKSRPSPSRGLSSNAFAGEGRDLGPLSGDKTDTLNGLLTTSPAPKIPLDLTVSQKNPLMRVSAKEQLSRILADPIRWVPATQKTFETEAAPRPQSKLHVKSRLHPEQSAKATLIERLLRSARVTRSWPNFARGVRPKGFRNPGNYCYRRSVMQAFLQLPVFVSWVQGHPSNGDVQGAECPSGGRCAACAMKKLIGAYYSQQPIGPELHRFDNFINLVWPQLKGIRGPNAVSRLRNSQQDADEFVHCILDAFCDAPRRTLPMPLDVRKALFEASLSRAWRCSNPACEKPDHPTIQSETGFILDITRPRRGANLAEYIQHYFLGDTLEEVKCDVCQRRQRNRQRDLQLLAGPEILIVQLRRFGGGSKIKSPVGLATLLDLTAYQPKQYRQENRLEYELQHVIYHIGSSITFGHYVSVCSGPAGVHEFDDSTVSGAARLNRPPAGLDPYLLMYTRKSVSNGRSLM